MFPVFICLYHDFWLTITSIPATLGLRIWFQCAWILRIIPMFLGFPPGTLVSSLSLKTCIVCWLSECSDYAPQCVCWHLVKGVVCFDPWVPHDRLPVPCNPVLYRKWMDRSNKISKKIFYNRMCWYQNNQDGVVEPNLHTPEVLYSAYTTANFHQLLFSYSLKNDVILLSVYSYYI